jgi:hypothetical protein
MMLTKESALLARGGTKYRSNLRRKNKHENVVQWLQLFNHPVEMMLVLAVSTQRP